MIKYLKKKEPKLLKQINKDTEFKRGDAFTDEDTGSATLINVDGQWEHDFADDPTKP